MKGGRDIRPFIAHRVTPLPLPIRVGEFLLCPFLINSPTGFARRGINILKKFGILGGYKVGTRASALWLIIPLNQKSAL
jgi:hypothetical protein